MRRPKPRLLMCVFNPIEFDGRVQRSAQSLAADFDVTVVSVDSGSAYRHPAFASRTVRLPARGNKYVAHVLFGLHLLLAVLRQRPTIVYAHDYFMAFPGWVAARLSRARFVYDAHELVIPAPAERLGRRDAVWYRLERAVVRRAEVLIAANEERAELMREHYRLTAAPIVVRNIAAPSVGLLDDDAVLARYPGLRRAGPDELLVVYQGDMSLSRGIGVFLDAARRLPARVRLVLVGSGPDHATIVDRSGRADLAGRVTPIGRVPRDHLYDILRLCDVGLISYPMQGLNNVYCAPNKVFEYAQAGLPMVTTPQPPLRAMMERYGIGEIVDASPGIGEDEAAAWARMIMRVAASVDEYRGRLATFLAAHHWNDDQLRLRRALSGGAEPLTREPRGAVA